MRIVVFLLGMLVSGGVFGQIGVTGLYNLNSVNTDLVDLTGQSFAIDNGPELQLHYWFRLKNQRVEFQPTIYYAATRVSNQSPAVNYRDVGFQFEVNLYPFDFLGDCDCPTFGKQGPHLEKGFFIQLFPGIAHRSFRGTESGVFDLDETTFIYGGGVGLDFGVTNFLTVTPIATLRRGGTPWNSTELVDINGEEIGSGKLLQTSLQLGLQATFRFDHKRY